MSSVIRSEQTKQYWRSLNELENTPEFQERVAAEFPSGIEEDWTSSSRRRFLQLAGASVALASASSCYWKEEKITPFAERPEGRVPGKSRYFATSMEVGGVAQPLVVTSYDGRPIKVEGNKEHSASQGATSQYAQAATLELYDPDRSRGPARYQDNVESESDWETFDAWARQITKAIRQVKGKTFAVLSEETSSVTMKSLRKQMSTTMPNASWHIWEPINRDNETHGCQRGLGAPLRPVYDFAAARVIVSLDDDPLHTHPDRIRNSRGFAAGRKPEEGEMNRLYAVESHFTVTGSSADHRLPLMATRIDAFLAALEAELATTHHLNVAAADAPQGGFLEEPKTKAIIKAAADDLARHQGAGIITVGAGQPKEVHARAHRLNLALKNVGKTVKYVATEISNSIGQMKGLIDKINRGEVKTLLIIGGNPIYNAPADLGFAEALSKVENVVHSSLYRDETSLASSWHLPRAHWMECWGDARAWDGTVTLRQPLIAPIWGGRSDLELVSFFINGRDADGHELVKQALDGVGGSWRKLVHDGFVTGSALPAMKVVAAQPVPTDWSKAPMGRPDGIEVNFVLDDSVYDGRFANSGWLQELPDPLTKMVWDNAAFMSAATAKVHGISHESIVNLSVNGRAMEIPIFVMPGHANDSITLPLGYGRLAAGQVAGIASDMAEQNVEPVGFDTYQVRTSIGLNIATGAKVSVTGESYSLVSTQDHHVIDETGMHGREERLGALVREGDLSEWKDHNDFAKDRVHHPPLNSMWKERSYETGHKWGMTIDLATCTGCSGCTIACQSENNIAVVGKAQVAKGRELHWIRMDRYFSGDIDDPEVTSQPVACHHCEMAPCEQVCPVAATTHTSEGLNDMIYNRCVGTRYCSNNCPYKVRRFNYHYYSEAFRDEGNEVLKLVNNPEVTVRSRGVMEKCTYCVQRIQVARIEASNQGRDMRDGDVTPACAQVCPTNAITFGDLNLEGSAVSKAFANPRSYEMLGELNLDTRTRYLARIRNPHPSLVSSTEHSSGTSHG